jgi:hypothetical protein
MTYIQLLTRISLMTTDQQGCEVTIFIPEDNEYRYVNNLIFAGTEDDVLDEDHPILNLEK